MRSVCIDCRYVSSQPSGIGEVVNALVQHLPAKAPDIQFLLLRNAEHLSPLHQPADNVDEIAVPYAPNGAATMWFLPRLVDLSGIDLFHAPANILPAGLGMKTITTVHDIMWLTNPEWCNATLSGKIQRRFFSHGIKRALRQSDHITTVSEASQQAILQYAPELRAKVTRVRSGVSGRFAPVKCDEDALAQLGVGQGKRFVLIVGQNAPYKNHSGAIAAVAKAFTDDPAMQLVLVQRRNSHSGDLRRLTETLGIADRVHFLDVVEERQLVQLYSSASVLLHPSLCEGFGNPLAEAMACGCPVITSNVSAMPEVTGDAAVLVSPHDEEEIAAALRSVCSDNHLSSRMRQAGIERASKLNWADFADQHLSIYRKILHSA